MRPSALIHVLTSTKRQQMNVFVLNTGRCGSTTFIKACEHITNYSCAHESRISLLGEDRLDYPENHIEADNRLSWLLGRLDKKYGDSVFYVHLKRNESDTARSFTKRYSSGIIKAYRGDGILLGLPEYSDRMDVAIDYCRTVNSNIELFLKDKSQKLEVNLETIDRDFTEFWKSIGAQGNIEAAIAEFNVTHNSTKEIQEKMRQNPLLRKINKIERIIAKFPRYINDA